MNQSAVFVVFTLLIGLFMGASFADSDIQEQQRVELSKETMHYILGLAVDIIQEGGDPIDVLEDALAKLRRTKTKRSPDHDESHLDEEQIHDAENDEFDDHDHDDHFGPAGDHFMESSLHGASSIDTHPPTDKPRQSTEGSLPSAHEIDHDDHLETTSPSVGKPTHPENNKDKVDNATQTISTTPSASSSDGFKQAGGNPSTPGAVLLSSPVDLSPTVPGSTMELPTADKVFRPSLADVPIGASMKPASIVSTSSRPPSVLQEFSSHRSTSHSQLPKDDHYEDEYIDTTDPDDPKLVHIKKKIKTEVGPNGSVHEHHESHSSTSLGDNPNSFSRQSSSSSTSSSSSINSFSSYRSGSNGQPLVSDTIITTDDRPNRPIKKQKPKVPHFMANHHHMQQQQQQPFGGFPNMPMMPLQMPLMPQMPMMPYGMSMGWPNFYGGQAFGPNLGKQPTGVFGQIAPNGQGAYASAFANAGGLPASAESYGPQSGEQPDRKRRHITHQLTKQVSEKKAQRLGFHKAPGGYWTD